MELVPHHVTLKYIVKMLLLKTHSCVPMDTEVLSPIYGMKLP
ncbi:hypothetical protein CCACVL1_22662 [Corchorus capsularis]|uniref:Uncharacterized protein n=1 Tax=Corchorus capsularis TaxID=210143 RepID=A0A1R3GXJ0_COCAP|nr:hypothetical protein CCACVL1_22662 [Corchorus capsularis]